MPSHLEGKVMYPVLDQDPWVGVIKTIHTALPYDSSLTYKIMIDVYDQVKDSVAIHGALREAGRTYNLLAANGVPLKKIMMAVIVYGQAINAILNDAVYEEKYGVQNPNLELINAMHSKGVAFYVCSQNLGFLNIPNESLYAPIEVALSAKTAIITLDQMGYSYLDVNE